MANLEYDISFIYLFKTIKFKNEIICHGNQFSLTSKYFQSSLNHTIIFCVLEWLIPLEWLSPLRCQASSTSHAISAWWLGQSKSKIITACHNFNEEGRPELSPSQIADRLSGCLSVRLFVILSVHSVYASFRLGRGMGFIVLNGRDLARRTASALPTSSPSVYHQLSSLQALLLSCHRSCLRIFGVRLHLITCQKCSASRPLFSQHCLTQIFNLTSTFWVNVKWLVICYK